MGFAEENAKNENFDYMRRLIREGKISSETIADFQSMIQKAGTLDEQMNIRNTLHAMGSTAETNPLSYDLMKNYGIDTNLWHR